MVLDEGCSCTNKSSFCMGRAVVLLCIFVACLPQAGVAHCICRTFIKFNVVLGDITRKELISLDFIVPITNRRMNLRPHDY